MPNFSAVRAASAHARVAHAEAWLDALGRSREIVIVAASAAAGAELVARGAQRLGGTFGWAPHTLLQLAFALAARPLAESGTQVGSAMAIEAVCASVVDRAQAEGALGRFEPLAGFPGLPRALAETFSELRLAGVDAGALAGDALGRLMEIYQEELDRNGLCDRAEVLRMATRQIEDGLAPALTAKPVLVLDVQLASRRESAFISALIARSHSALMTLAQGDQKATHAASACGLKLTDLAAQGPLAPVQEQLFSSDPERRAEAGAVTLLSAPGESRECVEIARAISLEAASGMRFDRMAIAVHAREAYYPALREALRRAQIPAWFSGGAQEPDASGRAILALLACAAEGLSAARFSEFLSLGAHRWPACESSAGLASRGPGVDAATRADVADEAPEGEAEGEAPARAGRAATARRWEALLVDAKVIGGVDRFRDRLARHAASLEEALARLPADDVQASERLGRDARETRELSAFATPLIDALARLPAVATWGQWCAAVEEIARMALARPERALEVFGDFAPMAALGAVTFAQLRLALAPRLASAPCAEQPSRRGRVFVGSADELRGLVFDAVFVPGLAERVFPKGIAQDPLLMDDARRALGAGLPTNEDRSEQERLALRLAIGAASTKVVATYPRLDATQGRPRTPSFYALDLVRAAEGSLPSYADVALRASEAAGARIGWPAPAQAALAIDDAEYDLAVLERVLRLPASETIGAARYLLTSNVHLGRTLRARWMRWDSRKWERADGLVNPAPEAIAALAAHQLATRSFSPTALQNFAGCPYRFMLHTIYRFQKREEPDAQLELDALQKGSLMHETLFETLVALREEGLLPVNAERRARAGEILGARLNAIASRYREELSPAIERVWHDTISAIKADLTEWLQRMERPEEAQWVPTHFELSFGLKDGRSQQDAMSVERDLPLRCGVRFRGSIDLVEQRADGALRATDFKSGKVRATATTVIGGGKTLQPALYALALAEHLPGRPMYSARLYYCTSTGAYQSFPARAELFDLATAEREAGVVIAAIGASLSEGFLPAAPAAGECEWCDFKRVCGPYEEQRTRLKPKDKLAKLITLRSRA